MVRWGISYFEVQLENQYGKYVASIDIPLSFLKEKGITKTLNGTKKLTTWLESDEGQVYIREQLEVA